MPALLNVNKIYNYFIIDKILQGFKVIAGI